MCSDHRSLLIHLLHNDAQAKPEPGSIVQSSREAPMSALATLFDAGSLLLLLVAPWQELSAVMSICSMVGLNSTVDHLGPRFARG